MKNEKHSTHSLHHRGQITFRMLCSVLVTRLLKMKNELIKKRKTNSFAQKYTVWRKTQRSNFFFFLKKCRCLWDLIEYFKILSYLDNITHFNFIMFDRDTVIRNNGMKLKWRKCNINMGKCFSSRRVIEHWNKLPTYIVKAKTQYI